MSRRDGKTSDPLKAAVVASLEECFYRLQFIIDSVSNGTDLSDSVVLGKD